MTVKNKQKRGLKDRADADHTCWSPSVLALPFPSLVLRIRRCFPGGPFLRRQLLPPIQFFEPLRKAFAQSVIAGGQLLKNLADALDLGHISADERGDLYWA